MVQLREIGKKVAETNSIKFQFQYGTIKSRDFFLLHFDLFRFNSNMVQLRATEKVSNRGLYVSFNSNMVQLRGN